MAITEFGRQTEYETGFEQFLRFMDAVAEQAMGLHREQEMSEVLENVLVELAAGALDGSPERETIWALLDSHPQWHERYETFSAQWEEEAESPYLAEIRLEQHEEIVHVVCFKTIPETALIDGVSPGRYTLRLSTGRVLWIGAITERDLIWHHAFPGRALDLAADTGRICTEPSRVIDLLDGEIVVRLYPGIETGRMSISLEQPKGTRNV